MGKNKASKKMSMKEFLTSTPGQLPRGSGDELYNLPSRPKERTGDDDGSFRRDFGHRGGGGGGGGPHGDRNRDGGGEGMAGGDSWKRGVGVGGGRDRGGGYGDRGGGGYGDRGGGYNDRGGFGGNDQVEVGAGDNDNNWRRGGGGDRGGSSYNNRGGGYGGDRGGGRGPGWGAGFAEGRDRDRDRDGWGGQEGSGFRGSGDRPRINLNRRTEPVSPPDSSTSTMGGTGEERQSFTKSKPKVNPFGGASAVDTASKSTAPATSGASTSVAAAVKPKPKSNPFGGASAVDTASKLAALELKVKEREEEKKIDEVAAPTDDKETNDSTKVEAEVSKEEENTDSAKVGENTVKPDEKKERKERKRREPKVVNSRAAALAEPEPAREPPRERRHRDPPPQRGPPPILNTRFANLAEEEADNRPMNRRDHDNDYPRRNDRLPSGPPPVQESRFRRAAELDERHNNRESPPLDDLAPPPRVQNSRFAAAAKGFEADREIEMRDRAERRNDMGRPSPMMENSGPPPLPTNSRFAAAAEEHEAAKEREMMERDERRSGRYGDDRGDDRGFGGGRGDDRGFGGNRGGRGDDRGFGGNRDDRGFGGNRDDRGFGNRGGDRGFGSGGDGGRYNQVDRSSLNSRFNSNDNFPALGKNKTDLTPPEMPKHLQPQKKKEPILPPVSAPLTLPGEDEEAARIRIEKKKREEEEKALAAKRMEEEAARKREEEEKAEAEKIAKAAEVESDMLTTFSSGDILGDDLQRWCVDQGAILPSVEKLVFHLLTSLTSKEGSSPDVECVWADKKSFGSALSSLVEDNVLSQMQVLFAVQRYCHDQGFPKIKDEYLVQAMFRAMYKYDLALDDAFAEWKEDESPQYEESKGKAIIQTMDWFNWLEAEDSEDEDEYEDYEEE